MRLLEAGATAGSARIPRDDACPGCGPAIACIGCLRRVAERRGRIDSRSALIMPIPTEPIGSIPRPPSLIEAARGFECGRVSEATLLSQCESAVQDTIARFEATGSKVITD